MTEILHISPLAPDIFEIIIKSPDIAKKAQAGHFVVLMVDEKGERIPGIQKKAPSLLLPW